MIRLITTICKTLVEIISKDRNESHIAEETADQYKPYNTACPHCGAVGQMNPYSHYKRFLAFLVGNRPYDRRIKILRFKCKSCKSTHALLPDVVVPYSPYSLRFILTVLLAYFERTTTVVEVCEHYCIAVSTLYRWKHRFMEHKALLLGLVNDRNELPENFIRELINIKNDLSQRLQAFFKTHGFSFMQRHCATKTKHTAPP